MNLAVVNEAVTEMNGVEHQFTEEEKNFVVQFAFRSGSKEDTISLIEALAHSADKAESDEIMVTYRSKYDMKPAWVEQVENLLEEVDGINDKIKEIIYQTQKSVDEDELTFKQSIAKSKECYVLLRVVRKIAKKKDKCEKQAIDNEFAIELDKDELKVLKTKNKKKARNSI